MINLSSLKDWREGINQVVCGDALDLLRMIPDKAVDLCLTDPPYGVGADAGVGGYGSAPATAKKYADKWDCKPGKDYFESILRASKVSAIFGGNYFTDLLPLGGRWIVWDKTGGVQFKNPFSDCELVWTTIPGVVTKKYICIQQGFIAQERDRFHPTQKPVALIRAILSDITVEGDLILDPFAGSFTTAVACKELGRRFIGCEISEAYAKIGEKRLAQEVMDFGARP